MTGKVEEMDERNSEEPEITAVEAVRAAVSVVLGGQPISARHAQEIIDELWVDYGFRLTAPDPDTGG